MSKSPSSAIAIAAFFGFAIAVLAGYLYIEVAGRTLVSDSWMEQQQLEMDELRAENQELMDDLFGPKDPLLLPVPEEALPYDESLDARSTVAEARRAARDGGRFLMVTFGANWCMDCRNLHRQLNSPEVDAYIRDRFEFVNVDVGKFNQNRDVADELGVSLTRGIPVAIFYGPDGELIGATNDGQLEPARYYSSKQILKFIRDIAERSRILAPDAVR
jgi:thioredoxin-related protein